MTRRAYWAAILGCVVLYAVAAVVWFLVFVSFALSTFGSETPCRDLATGFLLVFTLVPAVAFAPYVLLARWFSGGSRVPVLALALPWVLVGLFFAFAGSGCKAFLVPEGFSLPPEVFAAALALSPLMSAIHLALTAWRRRVLQ